MERISKQTQIELLIDEGYWAKKYQVLHVGFNKFGHLMEMTVNYHGLQSDLVWNKKSLPALDWAKIVDENYISLRADQLFFADTINCSIDKEMFDRAVRLLKDEILGIDLGN